MSTWTLLLLLFAYLIYLYIEYVIGSLYDDDDDEITTKKIIMVMSDYLIIIIETKEEEEDSLSCSWLK